MPIQQTPCQANPAAWEVPGGRTAVVVKARAVMRAAGACRACPTLHACGRDSNNFPPTHDGVQAAHVWIGGKRHTVEEWLQTLASTPRRTPEGLGVCEVCESGFEPLHPQQRYCAPPCANRASKGERPGRRTVEDLLRPRPATAQVADLKPCGTIAAYARHKDHGELIDPACREAQRLYDREKKRKKRASQASCGTTAGYSRHVRAGQLPCEPCRDARRDYQVARRAQRAADLAAA